MNVLSTALVASRPRTRKDTTFWLNRETALNWLALGLLLSAWNAVDDNEAATRRPDSLRRYESVSVRAVQRQRNGD